jgi:hypothetical protein
VLVEVDLTNPGPIFAMARLVVLAESKMKVVSDFLHIFGNFHTFEPNLLRPKLPSTNRILVQKPFPGEVWTQYEIHNPACISFISSIPSVLDKHLRSGEQTPCLYNSPSIMTYGLVLASILLL